MTDLFVTQTKPDLTLNKTINQGNNILHTPSLQHLYSRYLARYLFIIIFFLIIILYI